MAWKRLTQPSGNLPTDVNLDNVCYMVQFKSYSTLYFAGGKGDSNVSVTVKETIDEIHALEDVRPPSKSSTSPIGF